MQTPFSNKQDKRSSGSSLATSSDSLMLAAKSAQSESLIKGLIAARRKGGREPPADEKLSEPSTDSSTPLRTKSSSAASKTALEQEQDSEFNHVAILASIGGIGLLIALAVGRSFFLADEEDAGPEP